MSTRWAPTRASIPAVAARPLIRAALRPVAWTSRLRISRPSSGSTPASAKSVATSGRSKRSPTSNVASTRAARAPVRTTSLPTRSPSTAPSASIRIDLPAPVSPVSALNPGSKLSRSSSMIAKSLIASSSSMPAPGGSRRG
jgi:hypothetical protein